jgi:uncharacterized protein with HEPN domain
MASNGICFSCRSILWFSSPLNFRVFQQNPPKAAVWRSQDFFHHAATSFRGIATAFPRLTDIIEAIERIQAVLGDMPLDAFETDWQRQWLVERGVEIVSEASRRLTDELKERHPEIPWQKVAGVGNVLRHDYESIAAPVMWKLAQADLPALEKVCREELATELARE